MVATTRTKLVPRNLVDRRGLRLGRSRRRGIAAVTHALGGDHELRSELERVARELQRVTRTGRRRARRRTTMAMLAGAGGIVIAAGATGLWLARKR
jgi:hypothetical protein